MSAVRQAARPQRRRIFLGCEGEGERAYGVLLHRLVHERGDLHIDPVLLQPGGGDPLALVERACARLRRRARAYGDYACAAVLLDRDKWGRAPQRDQRIPRIAQSNRLELIWQRPTHEGFLLRHIKGCESYQPQTPHDALNRLRRHWTDYTKPMSADDYAARITFADIKRVCKVEAELATFLRRIRYFG
jgi:hypothetical protein